jgi:hypothetical protein
MRAESVQDNVAVMLATFVLLLAPYLAAPQPATVVPKDFAIRVEFGLCWRDIVDTRRDTYIRDLANGTTRTVRLRLSQAQRRQLVEWVTESGFFELPGELDAAVEKDGVITERILYETFAITVHDSGRLHQVTFHDNGDATSDAVVRIRTLAERLSRFFTQLPQVKRLPQPAVGCL